MKRKYIFISYIEVSYKNKNSKFETIKNNKYSFCRIYM